MHRYRHLIVGGGMTADAAVKGIRSADRSGTIGIISDEGRIPYRRPPLSKGLWKGEPAESVWLKNAANEATVHSLRTATVIRAEQKQVIDDHGEVYAYDKLLLATGGSVRRLPFAAEGVIYFRTFDDYEALKARSAGGGTAVVIGGGFIGSEIAAALAANGVGVTMVFPEGGIGARVYPPRLSEFLNGFYASKGVGVLANEGVVGISGRDGAFLVRTTGAKDVPADVVVAGVGIRPNVGLAVQAGLEIGNGIVVDEQLRTSRPEIFAAGDVAAFFNPALGKRIRVEHEDNANVMGECAGRNMAGVGEPYRHLPFF